MQSCDWLLGSSPDIYIVPIGRFAGHLTNAAFLLVAWLVTWRKQRAYWSLSRSSVEYRALTGCWVGHLTHTASLLVTKWVMRRMLRSHWSLSCLYGECSAAIGHCVSNVSSTSPRVIQGKITAIVYINPTCTIYVMLSCKNGHFKVSGRVDSSTRDKYVGSRDRTEGYRVRRKFKLFASFPVLQV